VRNVCEGLHSVWLAAVLVHASVDRVDDIRADRCLSELSTLSRLIHAIRCARPSIAHCRPSCSDRAPASGCSTKFPPNLELRSVVELTLKTLGTVMVSFVDSPLAEMTVTVGLDMVSCVGGCCC